MQYNKALIKDIGFDIIQNKLSQCAFFTTNKHSFLNINPLKNEQEIKKNQDLTNEICNSLERNTYISPYKIECINKTLRSLDIIGNILDENEFENVKAIFEFSIELKQRIRKDKFPIWKNIVNSITNFKSLLEKFEKIFDDNFSIKPSCSNKLNKINKEKSILEKSIFITANDIVKKANDNGWASNDKISFKNNRIVIPVIHSYKNKIPGIVQSISKTAQTIFIEPIELIEINNKFNNLLFEEKKEIRKILLDLTNLIRKNKASLIEAYHILELYDFHYTIAKFSYDIGASKPYFNNNNKIDIENAINPVFLLNNKKYIPLNIKYKNNNLLLISGPNAGGKTVVLKTVGLLCFMASCGLFVPASKIDIPLLDGMFSDIGDNQSIENDLSTFSSHISNINSFFKNAEKLSLILIDELGTGTEPEAGSAIAQTVIQEFINKGNLVLATTHLGTLKIWAEEHKKASNAYMQFDLKKIKPAYNLIVGKPGSSYAIEMLQNLGVDNNIIKKCKSLIKKEELDLEKILIKLQHEHKNHIELNKQLHLKLEQIKEKEKEISIKENIIEKEFKKARSKAAKEAEHIIKSSRSVIEKTIEKIKGDNKIEIKKQRLKIDDQLKKLKRYEYVEDYSKLKKIKEIKENMYVYIPHLKVHGNILKIFNKNKSQVLVGSLKMTLENKQLYLPIEKENENYSYNTNLKIDNISQYKIDVRGQRVDEAIPNIEKLIDTAIINGTKKLFILHGKGTGALITGIHKYLDEIDYINKFYFAENDFGGTGVTIIDL